MPKRPTIHDVAQAAGVSKSTVSLVLRNSPLVRETTRDLVRASMAEMGYVYNRSAAGLRGAASGLVGLVINDLRNPFFTEFAASAQMRFAKAGYATVISNTDEDGSVQGQVIASMIEHGVCALIISPAYGAGVGEMLAGSGIPTMQVLRRGSAGEVALPFASFDYASGGVIAAQHLVDQGARRVAFLGGLPDLPITQERMEGYTRVLQSHGMTPLHLPGRPSRALGRDLARVLVREHPEIDAAICFSDLVALGCHSGLAEQGVRLGRDFMLVGFDDIEECALVHPQLSSVRCNISEFGSQIAERVIDWVGKGIVPERETRSAVSLVERASSLRV